MTTKTPPAKKASTKKAAPAKPATQPESAPVDEELVAASIPDTTGQYWVTPELAELWLTRNTKNRPVREGRILTLARDMTQDGWAYTGESIKFSETGRLIDGQHRLHAILRSGQTVKMLVVIDVPDESQAFMDSGARRTAGDALAFRDETNATLLAATVRFAIMFEGKVSSLPKRKDSVSHAEIIDWLTDHPDIRRAAGMVATHSGKIDVKPSVMTYAMWRLCAIDDRQAQAFLRDLAEMRSNGKGDPIYTLLQRFRTARKHREYLAPITELSFIFRAWNAYRAGTGLQILKVPATDWEVVEPR